MESLVHDVPSEPYVEVKDLAYETEFVVDLDRVIVPTDPHHEEVEVDDAPVVLTWRNVSSYAYGGAKQILHNLNGKVTAGLYTIMGPSGSGKTSLLNTLACRLDGRTKVEGDVRLNGLPYTNTELKWMSAYVMQDDLLNGHLTVEETLMYNAELRMPRGTPMDTMRQRVEEVMADMNITHVRDVIVGTALVKGISGGERKRLCVAMELLTKPVLLFLDEPTTGLDSVAALALCTKLKALTDSRKCTVVCTIHQPQSKIFRLFDHLVLMNKGHIVYQGPAEYATQFFCLSGFPIPADENPADHFLYVITAGQTVTEQLKEKHPTFDVDLRAGIERPRFLPREMTPWYKQFEILFRRSMKEQWRKRNLLWVLYGQSVVIAILIGTVFLQIGTFQDSIRRRNALLFFCCINQGTFAALMTVNSFSTERILVLRERAAGTYFVSAYFLAKTTAETLCTVPSSILFSICVYWLVGLQPDGSKFIIFTIIMTLCSLAATSFALTVSTWGRTTDMAVAVLPMILEVTRLFGGFFLAPADLPDYFSWLDALSYIKYSYVGVALNELEGLVLYCRSSELTEGGTVCPVTSGKQTIDTLGLDFISIGGCIGVLVAFIFGARIFAYFGLRYLKH